VTDQTIPTANRSTSGRAKRELARTRDVRLDPIGALLAGVVVALVAILVKVVLNDLAGGETGYIILMAAVVLAAWFGGTIGGITATIVAVLLNGFFFVSPLGPTGTDASVERVRLILYLLAGLGTALLIASRRASRDRLADALDEVAALAEDIEGRDARIEVMLSASGTGFWEWDIPTGGLAWSEAIFEQHGMPAGGSAPSFDAYMETIHPDDREGFRQAIAASLDGGDAFSHEFRLIWPDGSVHWTHGAARVFRDDAGRPVRMLGTGQDITQRRRLEDERDRLLVEERQAGEFREAFVDVISHELRTPVTTILGMTEILARPGRTDDPSSRIALLEDVRAEAGRLHRLVEDLLVLSRVERGRLSVDPEPLEARRLIERIVAKESAELPTLRVTASVEPHLPVVAGEETYVEQIIRNLLGNAAKYTPAGTHVVVDVRGEGDDVAIRVCDDGPGVPEASIEHLFELFYRDPHSARTVSGSGIGLFVCSTLVEAMGGRMWARRRPEGGSEFGFTLRHIDIDDSDSSRSKPVAGGASQAVANKAASEPRP
jgi:K+-sensing histidine kinase KdpD